MEGPEESKRLSDGDSGAGDRPDSEFKFEEERTLGTKLWRTFLLFVVGGFFLIFAALVFGPWEKAWWLIALKVAVEICWSFWLLALLYVWFEWPWLRTIYLHSERRFVRLARLSTWMLPVFAAVTIGLVVCLFRIGILPLPPK